LLKCLRTDNGGEYYSNAFKNYCNKFGIKHENSRLEKNFWVEVVRKTCYLINLSPSTILDGGIPKEVWIGKKVNYSHLIFFGCEAFMHMPK